MSIEAVIQQKVRLPSPPAIAVKILQTVRQEDSSMEELARIICSDPALTARLLKVANSSIYSLKYRVANIEKALTVLGVKVLKNIALSFIIARELRGEQGHGFDFDYFWRRAVTAAVAGELLTVATRQKNDDIFVTSLLQDIGVLVLALCNPTDYHQVLLSRDGEKRPNWVVEQELFEFDHAQLGATLLENWGLPPAISEPIRSHHRTADASREYCDAARLLAMADRLSAIYHAGLGVEQVAKIQGQLADDYGLSVEVGRKLIDDVAAKSIEILSSFDIDPGDMRPYSEVLQEANEQLGRLNLSYEQLVVELKQSRDEAERLAVELRSANGRLRELVFRDGLTGLYNHRFFQEMLERELGRANRYAQGFALIMFDIDHFKLVNDSYGHPSGDLVLKQISQIATESIRPSDILARYGGEEFTIILPQTDLRGMRVFAERLRRRVEQTIFDLNGDQVRVTISLGGTAYMGDDVDIERMTIIDAADKALYQSKNKGRNRVSVLALEKTKTAAV